MATLTIRDVDEELKARLRVRAAEHGRSMEAEVRAILRLSLDAPVLPGGLGSRIHQRAVGVGADQGAVRVGEMDRTESTRAAVFEP